MSVKEDMKAGYVHATKQNGDLEIVNYVNANEVYVRFISTGYECMTRAGSIRNGEVKDVLKVSVHGIGYLGIGKHRVWVDGKMTNAYVAWKSMLQRAYDYKYHAKRPTYIGCSVYKPWHNFQIFCDWYSKQTITGIDGAKLELDKDLLKFGNKRYGPSTCTFIPQRINKLFGDSGASRGKYPVGIHFNKACGKYQAQLNKQTQRHHLGYFSTSTLASEAYILAKDVHIKEVANLPENAAYRDLILNYWKQYKASL